MWLNEEKQSPSLPISIVNVLGTHHWKSILIAEFVYPSIYTINQAKAHVILTYHCGFSVLREEKVGILRIKMAFQGFCWENFIVLSANVAVLYVHGMLLCQQGMSLKFIGECKHTPFPHHYLWLYLLCVLYMHLECLPTSCSVSCKAPVTIHWTVKPGGEPFKQEMSILLWMP